MSKKSVEPGAISTGEEERKETTYDATETPKSTTHDGKEKGKEITSSFARNGVTAQGGAAHNEIGDDCILKMKEGKES